MTFREKLMQEHPECVGTKYRGGCRGCPEEYGYENGTPKICGTRILPCRDCWDREMPEDEE